jgi:hypothetical protein
MGASEVGILAQTDWETYTIIPSSPAGVWEFEIFAPRGWETYTIDPS